MSMVRLPGLNSVIETMSQQRRLPAPAVKAALQEALMKGYERYRRLQSLDKNKNFSEDYFNNFAVQLDLKAEGFRLVATKTVVEKVQKPDQEIALADLVGKADQAKVGDTLVVDVTPDPKEFGRLAAHQTKQILTQKLQEQQCKFIQEHFGSLKNAVFSAKVLRLERRSVIFGIGVGSDLFQVEAELPNYEKLPNDNYQENAVFKVCLKKIFTTPRNGPLLRVSRATTHLIFGLFISLVPEIRQQIVEIKGLVRDAIPVSRSISPRCKMAVISHQPEVDPVAACIGERGAYLQAVVNEIRGEKIEVIQWSDDPATYIMNALTPALVVEVRIVDREAHKAEVIVAEDQLVVALGPEEQNLRLAARLTGWQLEITTAVKSTR